MLEVKRIWEFIFEGCLRFAKIPYYTYSLFVLSLAITCSDYPNQKKMISLFRFILVCEGPWIMIGNHSLHQTYYSPFVSWNKPGTLSSCWIEGTERNSIKPVLRVVHHNTDKRLGSACNLNVVVLRSNIGWKVTTKMSVSLPASFTPSLFKVSENYITSKSNDGVEGRAQN